MTEDRWRPLWAREAGRHETYDALAEGVPQWLAHGLIEWLDRNFLTSYNRQREKRLPMASVLREVEVRVRIPLDWKHAEHSAHGDLKQQCVDDGEKFLSVVDFALFQLSSPENRQVDDIKAITALERLLGDGGSAWMVGPDRRRLDRRVQPAVVDAARQVIESGSRAGEYLAEAWHHTYGRNPHPGTGYREAVRAVEAAVCPVIEPKRQKPTLGTSIAALRSAPPGKFTTLFQDNAPGVNALEAVLGLMGVIWTNQLDRHGTDDENVPLHVSPEQAEAALHGAVTLVQWFQRGVVRRAGP